MLNQVVDAISLNTEVARQTLERIRRYRQEVLTGYLPGHDPAVANRLVAQQAVFAERRGLLHQ